MNIGKRLIITSGQYFNKNLELLLFLDAHDHLIEAHVQDLDAPSLMGNIYAAKVMHVMKQTEGLFLRAGQVELISGAVPLQETAVLARQGKADRLCQGDVVLAQVVREAYDDKEAKARLTGLKGYLKDEMTAAMDESAGEDTPAGKTVIEGLILQGPHPFLFHIDRLLATEDICEVITDQPAWQHLLEEESIPTRLYADPTYPLDKLYGISSKLEAAVNPRVYLPSGGNIFIEHTQAMTVIDVNSGKNLRKADKEDYFLQTNLEAAAEVARQLRLRNISGMILVDFINMSSESSRQRLLLEMSVLVASDYAKVCALDITRLGLMELTRKREEKRLADYL